MSEHKHSMTGAWALNALDDAERAEVEAYLAENPEAAEEARGLAETAAHLATAAGSETPPPRAKKAIMAAIKQTRQLPPETREDSDDGEQAPVPAPEARAPEPAPEAGREQEGVESDVVSLAAFRRKQQSARILTAAATVLLLSTGALAGVVMVQQNELDETKQLLAETARYQEAVGQIMTASDAKMMNAPSSSGGMIHLSYSSDMGMMVLNSSDLPELPEGRAYELWLISDEGASPAGMLSEQEAAGEEPKILEGPMKGVTHIGITVEPAAGSEQPTTDPIVLSEL